MGVYPDALENCIQKIATFPGIGAKSATRMALHLLRQPEDVVREIARAMVEVKTMVRLCNRCFNFAEADLCSICLNPKRDRDVVCVVENVGELMALESASIFYGVYHVLQGGITPLAGIGPDDLRIKELFNRIKNNNIKEVVLALNPSAEGETTASYLLSRLETMDVEITMISYGIPMGGDIKYMDMQTLKKAMMTRRKP